ncbi:MAG: response regulator [Pseudomonadota bacterium]
MSDPSTKTALIVDDSKSARFALRKFLEAQGYQADAVESADEAYSYLKRQRPDLIFLDHLMPGVDGFDVLRNIKKDPRTVSIPVIICSSNEGADFVKQAKTRGAADVLPKPPDAELLTRILERIKPAKSAAPPVAAQPAPAKSKVAPIRDPEEAIEHALMKAVKTALATEPQATELAPELAPLASAAEGSTSLREEIGNRMRKITQDMYRELGDLKARVAHMDTSERTDIAEEMRNLRAQVEQFRTHVDGALKTHESHIEEMIASSRRAAMIEAHDVAERAVLSASSKLSDQLTENILKALGRR